MTRFWDARLDAWQVNVLPGELYVTRVEEVVATVLGSCVSACIRDIQRGIGGMNHFLLPAAPRVRGNQDVGAAARWGVNALELLLNGVLRGGGRHDDLEVKVFGGGRVLEGLGDIGRSNIAFVRKFFAAENIPILVEDVGGAVARRLRYWPSSGRVQCMHMPMAAAARVVAAELAAATKIAPVAGTVELF